MHRQGGFLLSSPQKLSLPPTPKLCHVEVRRLILKAQNGDSDARNRLMEANLRLVASLVNRFSGRVGIDTDDLFQIGCIGLFKAIEKFDLNYEVRFSTYAVPIIMSELHKSIKESKAVKITRHGMDLAKKALDVKEKLYNELGRSPTPEEIGAKIGVAKEEIVAALDGAASALSLDEPLKDSEGKPTTRLDLLPSQDDEKSRILDHIALKTIFANLSQLEQSLLALRYIENKKQTDVAKILGISQPQVSRLEQKILKHVREQLI